MLKEKEVFTPDVVTKKVKAGLSNGRGTMMLAIVGTCVSLCASFMFCLASIGFDFSQLAQTTFWSRWASMSISTLCVYALVILHKDEVNRLNEWYVERRKIISEKAKIVGEEFEDYLKEFNLKRRIDWHKRKINDKISCLNQRLLCAELKRQTTGVQKRIVKIKKKIWKLKERITDEYIEANKYTLKTRSRAISAAQVLSDTNCGYNGEVNFRSASAYYGGKSLAKICLSLAMTAAFACVVVQNFGMGVNIASIVMTVLTVLSVFVSIVSAILAANGCYKNVYVPNLLFKLEILRNFEAWKEKN